jgi:signal transduction histidine kinase
MIVDVLGIPTSKRILVVDDEERNRRLIDALLAPEGYEVLHAAGGAEALDIIAREPVDVVLLDRMMPGIDGLETCRRIRKDLAKIDLPIVFVTALADRDSRVAAKTAGADDFLVKPIDESELLARIENLVLVKAYRDLRDRQRIAVEAELARRTDQLLRAERFATLGTLAAGVGHELNNVGQVLMSATEMIKAAARGGRAADEEDLAALDFASQHLRRHATQLLGIARPASTTRERVECRLVVQSTVDMLALAGRTKYIDVRVDVPAAPVWVELDRVALEQVLVNLLANAADAISGVGSTANGSSISVRLESDGGTVRVSIADDGPGMPSEVRDRIFDPYFTTKPAGRGTGLGLPVVRQLVESFGSTLDLETATGRGTRFSFTLPAADRM